MNVGQRIRECRMKCGLSQVELADCIDVAKQTLYKYENGIVTNIPSDKIERIAGRLNVSPAYLMGWTDAQNAPDSPELLPAVNDTLTTREGFVIDKYRRLDEIDKGKIDERMDTMLESEKYKRGESSDVREIS